jgi:hypothetical protein
MTQYVCPSPIAGTSGDDARTRMLGEAQTVAAQLAAADPTCYLPPPTSGPVASPWPPLLRGTWVVCVHERRRLAHGSLELLVEWAGPDLHGPRLTWVDEARIRRIAFPEIEIFDFRVSGGRVFPQRHMFKSREGSGIIRRSHLHQTAYPVSQQINSNLDNCIQSDRNVPLYIAPSYWIAVLPRKKPVEECLSLQHPKPLTPA